MNRIGTSLTISPVSVAPLASCVTFRSRILLSVAPSFFENTCVRLSLMTKMSALLTSVIFSRQLGTVLPCGTSVATKWCRANSTPGPEL